MAKFNDSGDTLKLPTELKTIKPPYYLLYDYTTDDKAIIKF